MLDDFSAVGIQVECGALPDGCDDFIDCDDCPSGEVCGDSNQCGCEEITCNAFGGGAQCGEIPTHCEPGSSIDCGDCLGRFECVDNVCVCPVGVDCNAGCAEPCRPNEVCVDGVCCEPAFPCATNECSPAQGFPDGCGGVVDCPSCPTGEQCEVDPTDSRYECVNDCTCEARGFECGTPTICGDLLFCGGCPDPTAPVCDNGTCVCVDGFEPNDDTDVAASVCAGSACDSQSWSIDLEASLHNSSDQDYFVLDVAHTESTAIVISVTGLTSTRTLVLSYVCPDGSQGISNCSGSSSSIGSMDFCIEDGKDSLTLVRECDNGGSGTGRVYAGVWAKPGEYRGPCDAYKATIATTTAFDD